MTSKIVDVYGKYSLGSGAILSNADQVWNDLASSQVLAGYDPMQRHVDLQACMTAINEVLAAEY